MFRLAPDADIDGTHLVGTAAVAPAALVARFGPPGEGDEYKVSGTYVFLSDAGDVFTVYDWKETTPYWADDEEVEDAPTPEEYWADRSPRELHIGGRGSDPSRGKPNPAATAFRDWLLAECRGT